MNRDYLCKLIRDHSVVSFDIFDTLIHRTCERPEDVFTFVGKQIGEPGYKKRRIKAERKAYKELSTREDISYGDIYKDLGYKNVFNVELRCEEDVAILNREIFEYFTYALQLGKRVIIISDMYLSEETVVNILRNNDIDGYEKLYLSSSVGLLKRTGNLFKYVINDMNIEPQEMLHIGDNIHSDVEIPRSLGITAIHYKNVGKQKISREFKFYDSLFPLFCGNRKFRDIYERVTYSLRKDLDYWEKFGVAVAGPIFESYVEFIRKNVCQEDVVCFIARDGFEIKKYFDNSYPGFDTRYIYLPRYINIFLTFDVSEIDKYSDEIVWIVYSELSGDKGYVSRYFAEKFLISHVAELIKFRGEKISEFEMYVESLHIRNKNIVIVDSVSKNLSGQLALNKFKGSGRIKGIYYQVLKSSKQVDATYVSFMQEGKYNETLALIEFMMSSPEPPIKFITSSGAPEYFIGNVFEEERSNILKKIFKGVQIYRTTLRVQCSDVSNLTHSIIEKFINIRSSQDVDHFANVKFAYDVKHERYVSIFDWSKRDVVLKSKKILGIKVFSIIKRDEWILYRILGFNLLSLKRDYFYTQYRLLFFGFKKPFNC